MTGHPLRETCGWRSLIFDFTPTALSLFLITTFRFSKLMLFVDRDKALFIQGHMTLLNLSSCVCSVNFASLVSVGCAVFFINMTEFFFLVHHIY